MTAKVSNPLTVVAIFSGLAEAFATIALVNVPLEIQQIFVYFVMVFPILIVLLFFAVLNWNSTVLYAPGDFDDEAMYLELIRLKSSLKSEIIEKLSSSAAGGTTFTPQQIQVVSENVDRAIEKATVSPARQKILDLLSDGPKSRIEISQSIGLSMASVSRLLQMLREDGVIIQEGTGRSVQWSLSRASKGNANTTLNTDALHAG
jgi:DNA-binding transcriptional ArsR family regulator